MTGLCWGPKDKGGRRTVIAIPAPHNGHGAEASAPRPARFRKAVRMGYFTGFSGDQRRINSLLDELQEEYPSGMARRSSVIALLADQHPEKNDPKRGVHVRHAAAKVVTVLIRHGDLNLVNPFPKTREEADDPLLRF